MSYGQFDGDGRHVVVLDGRHKVSKSTARLVIDGFNMKGSCQSPSGFTSAIVKACCAEFSIEYEETHPSLGAGQYSTTLITKVSK